MLIPPWAYAAGAALTLAAGALGGWTVRDWKADADQLAEVRAAAKLSGKLEQAQADNATAFETFAARNRTAAAKDRDTIRETYREIHVPADCAVPAAGLGVLDGAIERANAAVAGEPGSAVPGDRASSVGVPGP
jgi:hypothetical protein